MENEQDLSADIAKRWGMMREKYTSEPDAEYYCPIIERLAILIEEDVAMVVGPATPEDLALCDTELSTLDYPELPGDYADFLKICGGFAFDGIEIYGTDIIADPETDYELTDVLTATEDFNDYYIDGGYVNIDYSLLCFGRGDGDYFTYDPQTGKYQVRSHEAIGEIWEEYDSFKDFFMTEVWRWTELEK